MIDVQNVDLLYWWEWRNVPFPSHLPTQITTSPPLFTCQFALISLRLKAGHPCIVGRPSKPIQTLFMISIPSHFLRQKKRQKLFYKCGNPQTTVSCVCVTKNFRHQIQLTIAFFYRLEQIYQINFEKNGLSNVFFDTSSFIISVKELYLFFSEMSTVKLSIWCLLRSGLYRSKLSNSTLVILMHIKYQWDPAICCCYGKITISEAMFLYNLVIQNIRG